MRIGIDARIWKTGIGRYTQNLINELAKIADPEDEYIIFLRKTGYEQFIPPNSQFKKVIADYAPYSFAEQILFPLTILKTKLDLMHFSNFNMPVLWPFKFILTIHDLIHLSHSTFGSSTRSYPYYLFKKLVYRFAIWWVSWRAVKVVVPSQATKDDLVKILKVNAGKVVVTYEGGVEAIPEHKNQKQDERTVLNRYNLKEPYLLYVATMYPHKNHPRLIEAFKLVAKDIPDLNLVLVGKVDFFARKIKDEVQSSGIGDRIKLPNFNTENGYISDSDLAVIYRHALVYVFPSLKEGFGIPILEAQSYGLPVVCSQISCLPEIAQDSAIYFDPYNIEEMKNQTEKVLNDPELKQKLIKNGFENIKRFSWEKMAKETKKVYKDSL